MSNVKKLKIGSTDYDIVDATAAHSLSDIAVAGNGMTFTTPSNTDNVAAGDKAGSPTISSSGIFTSTGTSQYIGFTSNSITGYSGSIFTGNYSWSWTFKFKSPADVTENYTIFRAGSSMTNFNLWCALSSGSSIQKRLNIGIHLSNNTWSNEAFSYQGGVTDLEPNTWYWVRVSRDYANSLYKLELSTDGTTWTTEISFSSSLGLFNTNATFFITNYSGDGTAEYDLTGCSFTSNYSSGINWVAYIADGRTTISSTALQNTATGTDSLTIDSATPAASGNSINIGKGSSASSNNSVVIGKDASADAGSCIAIGKSAKAGYVNSVAVGDWARSSANRAISIGSDVYNTGAGSVVLGFKARNSDANTFKVALHNDTTEATDDSTHLYTVLDSSGNIPVGRFAGMMTNYLTEVPQDIKLELNSGTLTLKAGSKVYVPNGFEQDGTTRKFTVVTIENDISTTHTGDGGSSFVYYRPASNDLVFSYANSTDTDTSTSTPSGSYPVRYRLDLNEIHWYEYGVVQDTRSLPIAVVQRTGSISSIDCVFNGVGYMGHCIFALPGIKGVYADGLNANGTIKNSTFTISNVCTATLASSGGTVTRYFKFGNDSIDGETYTYNSQENVNYSGGVAQAYCYSGTFASSNGYVTSAKIPTTPKLALFDSVTSPVSYSAGTGISISNGVISNTGLINTATGTGSLTIGGNAATGASSVNVGGSSSAAGYATSFGNHAGASGSGATALGYYSSATGRKGISVGNAANSTAIGAIQIGSGTNSTAGTMSVGLSTTGNPEDYTNYQLLDSSGNIPTGRMGNVYEVVQTLPASLTEGKIYFVTGS